ncbi:hypothetical protein [Pedobacter sp. UYP30]|uniref:hypothetical protein n=1 Tax=Pedobacter sp. UYP30 TaxID=1756400 RepID=UPI003392CE23
MKHQFFNTLVLVFLMGFSAKAQQTPTNLLSLQDSLNKISGRVLSAQSDEQKFAQNGLFVKTLVDALKAPNSYTFGFDSLRTVSIVKSSDRVFKLLTWYVQLIDGTYRFFGAIQMNTSNGALKLIPLIDQTENLIDPNIITNNKNWFGAKYYEIIPVTSSARLPYYILLGWKGNNERSTKRVIEIVSFDKGEVAFGAPVFDGKDLQGKNRLVFEYNKQNAMTLKSDLKAGMIVFDHLSPFNTDMEGKFEYYGSDGHINGLKIIGGRLKLQENVNLVNDANGNDEFYIDPKKKKVEN